MYHFKENPCLLPYHFYDFCSPTTVFLKLLCSVTWFSSNTEDKNLPQEHCINTALYLESSSLRYLHSKIPHIPPLSLLNYHFLSETLPDHRIYSCNTLLFLAFLSSFPALSFSPLLTAF